MHIIAAMPRTKLHAFLERAKITDTALSQKSGVSLRHIAYIKTGEQEPTRPKMAAILTACRSLTKDQSIDITDLFDFDRATRRRRSAA
jgi:predicted transcriptional regulator